MTSVLVVGSMALDTVETPLGKRDELLGGSATYFAFSASRLAPARIVSVVGRDFPREHLETLKKHGIDTAGIEVPEGKTFRWHGRYVGDMGSAETVAVHLNVLESFQPRVPEAFVTTPFVLLGNSGPVTQRSVLEQLKDPKFVLLDTMNLWIDTQREALVDLLPRVHAFCLNHEEALSLSGTRNTAQAIRKLLDLGVKTLVVKRGEHGATLATREFTFSMPAYLTEKVTDPTGAGDSFAGGMLGYLAANGLSPDSLRRALLYGTVMGSLAVEGFGTERLQNVTREEIDARARELKEMIRV